MPGYFEVYLKVSIDELRRRDPKNIYSRFDAGQIKDVAGLDIGFDEPSNPELLIEYVDGTTPEVELDRLLDVFNDFNN